MPVLEPHIVLLGQWSSITLWFFFKWNIVSATNLSIIWSSGLLQLTSTACLLRDFQFSLCLNPKKLLDWSPCIFFTWDPIKKWLKAFPELPVSPIQYTHIITFTYLSSDLVSNVLISNICEVFFFFYICKNLFLNSIIPDLENKHNWAGGKETEAREATCWGFACGPNSSPPSRALVPAVLSLWGWGSLEESSARLSLTGSLMFSWFFLRMNLNLDGH